MYSQITTLAGVPLQGFGNLAQNDSTRIQDGQISITQDQFWGAGVLVWARASAALRAQALVSVLPAFDVANGKMRYDVAEYNNAANSARPVGVVLGSCTSGQYAWVGLSGIFPVNCAANIAVGSSVAAGTGQVVALSAGKQLLGAVVVDSSTRVLVKPACFANSASNVLTCPNTEGCFVGMSVTGSGVAAGSVITGVDASGRYVTLSANTTSAVSGDVSFNFVGGGAFFNCVYFNNAFVQGQIA